MNSKCIALHPKDRGIYNALKETGFLLYLLLKWSKSHCDNMDKNLPQTGFTNFATASFGHKTWTFDQSLSYKGQKFSNASQNSYCISTRTYRILLSSLRIWKQMEIFFWFQHAGQWCNCSQLLTTSRRFLCPKLWHQKGLWEHSSICCWQKHSN